MIIKQIGLYTFNLPLHHPLPARHQSISMRDGVIIKMHAAKSRIAYGEAAPLPGLHKETLEDVIKQLAFIQSKLTGAYIPNLKGISGFLDTILPQKEWLRSARFAIEMAMMNLYLQDDSQDDKQHFMSGRHQKIMVNLLAAGNRPEVIRMVKRGITEGYQAVKLKVGQKKTEEDIELVRMVSNLTGPALSLRLDANRAWKLDQALDFAHAVRECPIEYIEEPLQNPDQLPVFYKNAAIPIAIDETVLQYKPENFEMSDWIDTLVLKPAAIGSIADTLAFIRIAELKKRKIVISDSFQSGVGFSFLLRLAASLNDMIPMGFDTYQWLKEDLLDKKIQIEGGKIDAANASEQSKKIKSSSLMELSVSLALREKLED
jgi:O-succinylbenzoate synthase